MYTGNVTRRELLSLSIKAAFCLPAATFSGHVSAQSTTAHPVSIPVSRTFPTGFFWGVATSAYQIEGAWNADGKRPSIWDTYAHTPGKIRDGSNGNVANDHYHRYKEDVSLMHSIGAKAYRFSISWPRIFPAGTGQPNSRGLDFYSRLTAELLANGVEPFATLYHWDLPQTLQDKGGWQSRDTTKAFGDYAGYVAEKLSDRVRHFFTINEFHSFVDMGYRGEEVNVGGGTVTIELAPGLKLASAQLTTAFWPTDLLYKRSGQRGRREPNAAQQRTSIFMSR